MSISGAGAVGGQSEEPWKVIVVGQLGTGKTSFAERFKSGLYSPNYKTTVGVDFYGNEVDGKNIMLWDIAGQERFGNMTRVYYKDAVGAIILYDVTSLRTFEAVKKWKDDIDVKVKFPGTDLPLPTLLVANKIDLLEDANDSPPTPSREELRAYCKENGFITFAQTSVKNNTYVIAQLDEPIANNGTPEKPPGVKDAIKILVEKIKTVSNGVLQIEKPDGTITLSSTLSPDKKKEDTCCQ